MRQLVIFLRLSLVKRQRSLVSCMWLKPMMHSAQKAQLGMVVSRMSIMHLEMVALAVSSMTKGMGNVMGRRTILLRRCLQACPGEELGQRCPCF